MKLKKFVSIEIIKNIGKDIDPKIYLKDSLITFIQKSLDNNAYSMVCSIIFMEISLFLTICLCIWKRYWHCLCWRKNKLEKISSNPKKIFKQKNFRKSI